MFRIAILCVCLLFAAERPCLAVLISGGDGTGNTTGTGAGAGWNYTGTVLFSNDSINASGVYLGAYDGAYWVLTAYHVAVAGLGSFNLGGYNYSFVTGSAVQISGADMAWCPPKMAVTCGSRSLI